VTIFEHAISEYVKLQKEQLLQAATQAKTFQIGNHENNLYLYYLFSGDVMYKCARS